MNRTDASEPSVPLIALGDQDAAAYADGFCVDGFCEVPAPVVPEVPEAENAQS